MSGRDQFRPPFTEEQARVMAKDLFGIDGVITELPSERDRNFFLRTDSGDEFVLKIAATSEQREILEFQNQAMKHLLNTPEDLMSPQVRQTVNGEEIGVVKDSEGAAHFVRLVSYLPGKVLAEVTPHSAQLLWELGVSIGQLSKALASFSHPATKRALYWDLKNAPTTINQYIDHIASTKERELVEHFLGEFQTKVQPHLSRLRTSVIHNDGNDYNIIVKWQELTNNPIFGILDFGDMVHSHTVFELAVAVTYAILGKADPVAAAAQVVGGYHAVFPLTELEIEVLFLLVCTRLAMSVSISVYQKTLEPDNEYLSISEKPAWEMLQRLRTVHPRFATYVFRDACGLPANPESQRIVEWLQDKQDQIGSLIDIDVQSKPVTVIDFSVGSLEYGDLHEISDTQALAALVANRLHKDDAVVGVGRYNEARLVYRDEKNLAFAQDGLESRTIHLGMELFLAVGSPIKVPLDGVIHSIQNNPGFRSNGPTIILEHSVKEDDLKFFTLYAHLSSDSLEKYTVGQRVRKGELIGKVGDITANGGWPSSVRFQLISDIFDWKGDFPHAALPSQRKVWLSICPDPNNILRIPAERFPPAQMSRQEILDSRARLIGKSLSISYKQPLKIVRGFMQYLYDEDGRRYLDGRNNVPHVGHSHPKIVKALQDQAAVLNTNTRYLHENLVQYAKRLTATLPEPLRVCFFVNSGSEANELALRLARTHTGHSDVIVVNSAYHGNTGTMIDISPYKFDGPGGSGAPSFVHTVRIPDVYRGEYKATDSKAGKKYAKDVLTVLAQLKKEGKGVAAFICEPLMGVAGQIVLPRHYLQEVFQHTRKAGGLCIVDEVQVGFGRVGTHFWGFQTQNVIPDIITLGKPIGNGHPLAAVVTTPEVAESFANGMEFFSTTGGNPVSCAVGMALLDVIEEKNLQQHALTTGNYLMEQLRKLQDKFVIIGDVRGVGLFIGVELVLDSTTLEPATLEAGYVRERMKELGVLISTDGPFDNVLKIKPPLCFTKENADVFIQTLAQVLSEDPIAL
jgi:4-aminobutyrate aminotransferase-like enzyme/Ser/Thr protein kinase RdoA (MazF antagonist)